MKRIVVVGMSEDTRGLVPWSELGDDCEVWVLNEMGDTEHPNYEWIERWDRLWQIHPRWDFTREHNYNHEYYWGWLQNQPGDRPIIMQEAFEDVPGAAEYPIAEIMKSHSDNAERFTATLPYILAYCAYLYLRDKELERIDLYGFSMASNTEYAYQRDTTLFWLGVLEGLYRVTGGPFVYVPEESKLHPKWFKLYGYEGTQLIPIEDLQREADKWEKAKAKFKRKFDAAQAEVLAAMNEGKDEKVIARLTNKRSELFQRFWGSHARQQENEQWAKAGVPVPRMHFELRNRSWSKEFDNAKVFLNSYAGQVKQLSEEIDTMSSRKRGLKKKKMERLQELTEKQEKYAQTLIYTGAAMEVNRKWIKQCDMVHQGFEPEQDTDADPGLVLRFLPED